MDSMLRMLGGATCAAFCLSTAHAAMVTETYTSLYEYVLTGSVVAADSGAPAEPGNPGDSYTQVLSFTPTYDVRTETASVSYDNEFESLSLEVAMDATTQPFVLRQDIDWQWDDLAALWVSAAPLETFGQVSLSRTRTSAVVMPIPGGGNEGTHPVVLTDAEIEALLYAGVTPEMLGLDIFNGITQEQLQHRLYIYQLELAGVTPAMLGGDPLDMSRAEIEARLQAIEAELALGGVDPDLLDDPQALQDAIDALEQAAQDYANDNPGNGGGVVVTPLPGGAGLMLSALVVVGLARRRVSRAH